MEQKPTPAARRQAAVVDVFTPMIHDATDRTNKAITSWLEQLKEDPNCAWESISNEAILVSIQNLLEVVDHARKAIKLAGRVLEKEA